MAPWNPSIADNRGVSDPAAPAVPPSGVTLALRPGKNFAINWRSALLLILAATVTSILMKQWAKGSDCNCPWITYFLHTLVYSACVCSLLLYSASRSWSYISRRCFPLNWLLLFVSILIPATAGTLLSGLILVVLSQHSLKDYAVITTHSLQMSLLLSLIFGISFYLYENLRGELEATTLQLQAKRLEEERARKLAIAAQLSSLESRVRPHFLFNTLNSISSLIRENPERAERMVEHLAALLRFSLDANQRRTVPLGNELKLVNDYLEIEQARFNARLRFSMEVPAELNAAAVPPFALQTLVENSVKHAIAPRRIGGEIRVAAAIAGDKVRLEVHDDGPGFTPEAITSGHGLDNLQARLVALYGGKASLDIEANGHGATVRLTLPRLSGRMT